MYNVHFRVGWNSTIISLKTLRKVLLKGKVQRDFRPPNFLIIWTFLVLWPMDYNIFDLGLRFRLVSSLARPSTCTIVHVCIRTFLYVFTSKYTQSLPNSRIMIANTKNLCMVGQVNKDRWEQTSRHTAKKNHLNTKQLKGINWGKSIILNFDSVWGLCWRWEWRSFASTCTLDALQSWQGNVHLQI